MIEKKTLTWADVNRDIPGWDDPIIEELHATRRKMTAEYEADPEGYMERLKQLREEWIKEGGICVEHVEKSE